MTKKEKIDLYSILSPLWVLDNIISAASDDKEFKDMFGLSPKRAEKIYAKLLLELQK